MSINIVSSDGITWKGTYLTPMILLTYYNFVWHLCILCIDVMCQCALKHEWKYLIWQHGIGNYRSSTKPCITITNPKYKGNALDCSLASRNTSECSGIFSDDLAHFESRNFDTLRFRKICLCKRDGMVLSRQKVITLTSEPPADAQMRHQTSRS